MSFRVQVGQEIKMKEEQCIRGKNTLGLLERKNILPKKLISSIQKQPVFQDPKSLYYYRYFYLFVNVVN